MTKLLWLVFKLNAMVLILPELIETFLTEQLCMHILYRFEGQGVILKQVYSTTSIEIKSTIAFQTPYFLVKNR